MTTETLKSLSEKVALESVRGPRTPWAKQDEWQQKARGYRCTLHYQDRQYSFDFWQGQAISHDPDAEGVLDCLLSDANAGEQSFEDFCADFGYDTDSRKAEKTWELCQQTSEKIRHLLGEDYETFLTADRN